ncbi:MAG: carotenoid oxygenase family protein [Acidobacteria bacterium]|nr:carotenoid oxygenase family protein [Acidobacteriota bacterium]
MSRPPAADHAPGLERAFSGSPTETAYRISKIEGEVPAFVRGSYYVNGPARFERGAVRYRHWLDGDGMVCALHFGDDGVDFACRFVRSAKATAEDEAGTALFRTFGTAFDGDRLQHGIGLASPVNVSVYPFAGRLLAFGEQGLPLALDPLTLETQGEHTFGRRLNTVSPFAAHPAFDPESGEMFNFGVSFSARQPCLHLYRFAADGELLYRRRLSLDAPCSVHDFGLSEHHAIFHLGPYVLDMERLASPASTLMDSLEWQPDRGTRLVIADRETGELTAEVQLDAHYCLHLINAWEEGSALHVEILELERPVYDQYWLPDLFTDVRHAQPVRYTIDLPSGRLVQRHGMDEHLMVDFPAIDPRRAGRSYPWFWVLGISATEQPGRKFFDRVLRGDWRSGGYADVYQAETGRLLGGEPVFIPDLSLAPEAGRGVVVCQEHDPAAGRSAFLVLDAFDLASGPVARLPLENPIHLGFHTTFHPTEVHPAEVHPDRS